MQRVQLLITVVDYDRVGASEPIGKVLLGCDQKGPELRHWSEMLASPRRPVAQWHTLKEIESKSICLKYVPMSAKVLDSCFASLAKQFIWLNTGQIISKGLLVSSNSPKKWTNKSVFTTTMNLFIRFLEEFEDTKKSFQNYLTFSHSFYRFGTIGVALSKN